MGKKKKSKAAKHAEKRLEELKPPVRFTPLSEIPREKPTPIKIIPEDARFALAVDPAADGTYVAFTHDRDGVHYHELPGAEQSPAMKKMKEWIESQYTGDSKVEAAIHPKTVDEVLDESFRVEDPDSVRSTFGGPSWREMAKKPAFGVNDQPAPVANDKPSIHDLVVEAVLERKKFGLEKYGTYLQAGNGRKSLKDALEEILDLACYLMCVIVEEEESKQTDQ